ncbi:MAG: tRNA (adenosine(37)-N6)-threonylcarbamoyltransferase complex dimerization subunit type 1 TsaB [Candidatus Fibromonas sp.]|jgi:tRNA threonylcarbamoyladenosine biosynthesis protein TsaB|nr:tRNA (adenosine(37)-N6)-threonylcarbamoyltransferase complex dimerization subunit type 1 TsaB [Candidatus Fibromonas sp.]
MDLVVDCSRKGVNLGLYASGVSYELFEPNAKGDELGLLLNRLLSENNFELEQVKRVLVTLGPGSFTGIRAGIAFCEGLCFSGKRTLHGVSTLRALASHFPEGETIILHARANLYYVLKDNCESLAEYKIPPQTHENLPITPFAKLIPQIEPSRTQKANYLMNPYSKVF